MGHTTHTRTTHTAAQDQDLAGLEHHLRDLLIQARGGRGLPCAPHGLAASPSKAAHLPWDSAAMSVANASPSVPTAGHGPWSVLQVNDDSASLQQELVAQLAGASAEIDRLRAQVLADRAASDLQLEDLRAKLVGAAAQEQASRELQAQVGTLVQTREENTRVIRLLEQEVSDLQRAAAVAAAGGEEKAQPVRVLEQEIAAHPTRSDGGGQCLLSVSEAEKVRAQNTALRDEVAGLQRKLLALQTNAEGTISLEQQAALHAARLKRQADLSEAHERVKSLEAAMKALQTQLSSEGTAAAAAAASHEAEKSALAERLALAESKLALSEGRADALACQVGARKVEIEDLRRKVVDSQRACDAMALELVHEKSFTRPTGRKDRGVRLDATEIEASLRDLSSDVSDAQGVVQLLTTRAMVECGRQTEREEFLAGEFAELRQRETELLHATGAFRKGEAAWHQSATREHEQELRELHAALAEAKDQRDAAMSEVDKLTREGLRSRQRAHESATKVVALEEEMQEELDDTAARLRGVFEKTAANMREELRDATARLDAANLEIASLKAEIDHNSCKVEEADKALSEKARVERDLASTTTALVALKREMSAMRNGESTAIADQKREVKVLSDRAWARLGKLEARSRSWNGGGASPTGAFTASATGTPIVERGGTTSRNNVPIWERLHSQGTEASRSREASRSPPPAPLHGLSDLADEESPPPATHAHPAPATPLTAKESAFMSRLAALEALCTDRVACLEQLTSKQTCDLKRSQDEAQALRSFCAESERALGAYGLLGSCPETCVYVSL